MPPAEKSTGDSMNDTLKAAAALALALGAAAAGAQDLNQARNLAATCITCHGPAGGAMRSLMGMPADRIVASVNDYVAGRQPATVMHQIGKGYTEEQLRLIATWFAAQKPMAGKP